MNPLRLLECLLVLRPAGQRLVVGRYNLFVEVVFRNRGGGRFYSHLGESPRLGLGVLEEFCGELRLELADQNVTLAAHILTNAIDANLIEVIDEQNSGEGYEVVREALKGESPLMMRNFVQSQSSEVAVCADEGSWVFARDLGAAMQPGWSLATDDQFAVGLVEDRVEGGLFLEMSEGLETATLSQWAPRRLDDILRAIEAPSLLPELVEAVERVVAKRAYDRELIVFLPSWLADAATGGLSSLVRMGYKVLSRRASRRPR